MSNSELRALLGEDVWKIRQDGFLDSYEKFVEEILREGALTKKEKFYILLGVYASKGWLDFTQDFLSKRIRQVNIKAEEVIEILETAVLSRGPIPWIDGHQIISSLLGGEHFKGEGERSPSKNSQEMLEYFKSRFQEIPDWIEMMSQRFPKAFQHYYSMRSSALDTGLLPRKIKELVLVGINATGLYHEGMKGHMKGALQAGASKEEILETLLISILGGGIVSWVEGISVMKDEGIM
jgi:alkylhydroperoxidase/carboxymuconolactone decarboxylase family protein YurZ